MFRTLHEAQPLRVISDAPLARRVDSRRLPTTPAVTPKTMREVDVARWGGSVRPFEILHLLGEALTPVLPRGAFEESSRWALYRYFWAFAPAAAGQPLRLSGEASGLVDHHRTLASEQLGIGVTLRVGSWLIEELAPGAIIDYADADIVVDRGAVDAAGSLIVGRVSEGRRMRPDYFFTATERASGIVSVYAVEAKGTHTRGHYVPQMKKGASQVAAITINGALPDGYIFSTELSADEIVVRILDPEGDPAAWSGPAAESRGDAVDQRELVAWSEAGTREVTDPPRFRRAILQSARAALLAFSGQYASAAARIGAGASRRHEIAGLPNAPTLSLENDLGRFEVIEAELALGGGRVQIRCGIDGEALAALRDGDEARYDERRRQLEADITARAEDDQPPEAGGASLRGRSEEPEPDAPARWAIDFDEDDRAIRSLREAGSYLEVTAR